MVNPTGTSGVAASTHAPSASEPKLFAPPPPFTGERDKAKLFTIQVRSYILAHDQKFSTETLKTQFFLSLISTGPAATWAEGLLEEVVINQGMPTNYSGLTALVTEFLSKFGPLNAAFDALGEFRQLRQGKGTAEEYFVLLENLGIKAGHKYDDASWWNDTKKTLIAGLNESLVKDIAPKAPKNYKEYKEHAIEIDRSIRETQDILRTTTNRFNNRPRTYYYSPPTSTNTTSTPQSKPRDYVTRGEADMEVDRTTRPRGKLSPAQREFRRRNNLCFYCGKGGHMTAACPEKTNRGGERIRQVTEMTDEELKAVIEAEEKAVEKPGFTEGSN
jgi:hypothetical protein